jgi:hypothetical protein
LRLALSGVRLSEQNMQIEKLWPIKLRGHVVILKKNEEKEKVGCSQIFVSILIAQKEDKFLNSRSGQT